MRRQQEDVMLARLWQGGGRGRGSRAREAVEGIEVGQESREMRGLLSAAAFSWLR